MSRTNSYVEIEHWLLKLLEIENGDLQKVLKQYSIDVGRVNRELSKALETFKTGSGRVPSFSEEISELMQEAWTIASLEYGSARVAVGPPVGRAARRTVTSGPPKQFVARVEPHPVGNDPQGIAGRRFWFRGGCRHRCRRAGEHGCWSPRGRGFEDAGPRPVHPEPHRAGRKGEIDPVIGRDFEIRQVIDILTRRRQNNPILTGEAGVGKTAVVEGFALRIVAGDVPAPLKNVAVRTLDLGLLQAGAGVKGEFENRLKSVIAEVKASPKPIILFIDEAHTLIGAGGAAGQGDAANLLKPALARGELRTIAATTWTDTRNTSRPTPP